MSTRDDGGPAFPLNTPSGSPQYMPARDGMSLRDWFAGQAIDHMISLSQDRDGGWCPDNVARGCYNLADAMLRARGDQP